ncbi:MAG TPA: MFS transporter [Acidimicrobiales bacterium]|nr:MFS transporter [Acidimicrobiales bacterium]
MTTIDRPTPTEQHTGRLRTLFRDAGNWAELRRSPYGVVPAGLIGGLLLFEVLDNRVFDYGGPEIARSLGISIGQIVTVIVTIGVFLPLVSLFIGWYADRHPRLPVVWIGAVLSGVAAMLGSFARPGAFTLGSARVGDSVLDEGSNVPRYSLLADYYPPEVRGKAFSIVGGMRRFGDVIAPLLIGATIIYWGWRPAFVVFGAGIVVMGALIAVRLREPVRGYMERRALGLDEDVARVEDEPQSFGEAWRTVWGVRTLRRLFVSDLFSGIADVFSIFFIFFLSERYGLSALQRGFVLLPATVTGLLGYYLGGGLIDTLTRRNPGQVLTLRGILQTISALSILVLALQPPLAVIVVFQAITVFGLSLTGPASNVIYAQVIPASIRTQGLQVFGLTTIFSTVVFFPVWSQIHARFGYPWFFASMVPVLLIGALVATSAGAFFGFDMRSALAATAANEEWRRAKASGKGKLLVCRDVDVEYDGVQVLFGVDFDVEEGQIIALLGTNGAGKSTLLRAIGGLQEASAGAVVFDGRDVTHMPPHEIAHRGVITMPGGRGVFPELTVRENILLGTWMLQADGTGPEATEERLQEVLAIFPALAQRADALAGDLSGGEQQQLSLAQAFLSKPKLLMIDELSLGLSPAVVGQLLEVVRRIHAEGVTIIIVEQSVNVALNLAQKAIFMEKGEVRFFGDTADLLRRPDILRAVYVKGTGATLTGGARRGSASQRALEQPDARPVLEVSDVVKRYGGVNALDGVSLELREGEVLGLIGPNGSGKTTLFDIISGFQTADAGVISYEGVDISALAAEERARRGLVRRFQDARLFPSLTVFETLLVSLEQRMEVRSAFLSAIQLPQARRAERRVRLQAERLIDLLDLGAYRDKFVKELSTGLRRIVDLACVLATEPKVLLLDEPSSGIAQAEAESLGPLLGRIRFETGCSILIIEHDMPLISAVADELVALEQGLVVVRGLPDVVLNDERVIEAYLGGSEQAIRRSGSLV